MPVPSVDGALETGEACQSCDVAAAGADWSASDDVWASGVAAGKLNDSK
jgi:hypothetical protein